MRETDERSCKEIAEDPAHQARIAEEHRSMEERLRQQSVVTPTLYYQGFEFNEHGRFDLKVVGGGPSLSIAIGGLSEKIEGAEEKIVE